MAVLTDIPVEVFIDNLLPLIPLQDLLQLGSTTKFFAALCADDTFWKRKLQADFNFPGLGTARTSGWKFIYQGLSKPRVFVWGQKAHGRLGLSKLPKSSYPDVPFPTELRIPGVRIVSLIAGGMSFHALDSDGNIHVWGTLDGEAVTLNSDGFSEPGKTAPTPLRLKLPNAIRSISCGRLHAAALDSNNHVWNFLSWGRPFTLSTRFLNAHSIPIQIECGWGFSSLLTNFGDVFVWWPFSGEMHTLIVRKNEEMDQQGDKRAHASDGSISCVAWDLNADPVRLPKLPPLPELSNTGTLESEDVVTQLIQIAAFDAHLVGLTNKGHVLKFGALNDETTVSRGQWEYLPAFSEVEKVRQHPVFSPPQEGRLDDPLVPPQTMKITHIYAHFQTFIAFSTGASSIVIMGDEDTTPDSEPNIIPALQNKSVISVVLGDYHYGALTSNGKLLAWGAYSAGALGLGDPDQLEPGTPGGYATENQRQMAIGRGRRGVPPAVEVPTEVRFDHGRKKPKEMFCFSAAAAGWHTGALVIDLEPDESDEEDEDSPVTNTEHSSQDAPPILPPYSLYGPGEAPTLPFARGGGVFRVGYAGRGINPRGGLHIHPVEGSSVTRQDPSEPYISHSQSVHRIGFAGRGMDRDMSGANRGRRDSS